MRLNSPPPPLPHSFHPSDAKQTLLKKSPLIKSLACQLGIFRGSILITLIRSTEPILGFITVVMVMMVEDWLRSKSRLTLGDYNLDLAKAGIIITPLSKTH
jgi:hypothetical protein